MGSKGKTEQTVQVQQTAVQNQETNIDSIKALQGNIDGLISVLNAQAKNPSNPTTFDIPFIFNAPQPAQAPPSISVPVTLIMPDKAQQPAPVANTTGPGQTEYQNNALRSLLSSMYLSLIGGQPPGQAPPAFNTSTLVLIAAIVVIAIWYFRR